MSMMSEIVDNAMAKLKEQVDPKFAELMEVVKDIQNDQAAIKDMLRGMK